MVSYGLHNTCEYDDWAVLILIVVGNGLVLERFGLSSVSKSSLNPYYSGRWSRTMQTGANSLGRKGLNPYCSGEWSRTGSCSSLC